MAFITCLFTFIVACQLTGNDWYKITRRSVAPKEEGCHCDFWKKRKKSEVHLLKDLR